MQDAAYNQTVQPPLIDTCICLLKSSISIFCPTTPLRIAIGIWFAQSCCAGGNAASYASLVCCALTKQNQLLAQLRNLMQQSKTASAEIDYKCRDLQENLFRPYRKEYDDMHVVYSGLFYNLHTHTVCHAFAIYSINCAQGLASFYLYPIVVSACVFHFPLSYLQRELNALTAFATAEIQGIFNPAAGAAAPTTKRYLIVFMNSLYSGCFALSRVCWFDKQSLHNR